MGVVVQCRLRIVGTFGRSDAAGEFASGAAMDAGCYWDCRYQWIDRGALSHTPAGSGDRHDEATGIVPADHGRFRPRRAAGSPTNGMVLASTRFVRTWRAGDDRRICLAREFVRRASGTASRGRSRSLPLHAASCVRGRIDDGRGLFYCRTVAADGRGMAAPSAWCRMADIVRGSDPR